MKAIRISDAVWQAIADRGKFGETPNMVLERVFGIAREGTPPKKEKEMLQSGTMYTLNELDRLELGKDTRPERFQLGDEIVHVQTWIDVCKCFVEWLIRNDYLVASKCPVPTGSERMDKYFINTKPVHGIPEKDGDWREVGQFFVDVKYNALFHVKNIRGTLRHLTVRDPGISIAFRTH